MKTQTRGIGSMLAGLAVGASLLGVAHAPLVLAQVSSRVSVASDGTQANDAGSHPAITDGRYIAFASAATNLVSDDTNGQSDIFVRDTLTGTTTRVSIGTGGGQATGCSTASDVLPPLCGSFGPAISAGGRFVAFGSGATNLVVGDTNGQPDIFVHDRLLATTTRVSLATGGLQATGCSIEFSVGTVCGSFSPAISADGRFVAFAAGATNLVPGDTNERPDVFVHDRQSGTTARVSVATGGLEAVGCSIIGRLDLRCGSSTPVFSADGRFVAFESHASNLVPGDTNGAGDVFVHDRFTATTTRVSVAAGGAQANACTSSQIIDCGSGSPALSADGRFVAFGSSATNLVPGDTNGAGDVFVHDRVTATTTRVSVASNGAQANAGSFGSAISADGRFVAFGSEATNLDSRCANGQRHIAVHDRATGVTTCVSLTGDGTPADFRSFATALSGGAHLVASSRRRRISSPVIPTASRMSSSRPVRGCWACSPAGSTSPPGTSWGRRRQRSSPAPAPEIVPRFGPSTPTARSAPPTRSLMTPRSRVAYAWQPATSTATCGRRS